MDTYSRCVVGWTVAVGESSFVAQALIRRTLVRQGIRPGQLTIRADRVSSMTSKHVAMLLYDLGVTKTHRPHTSNDNPFSEAQFKTLKYRPDFPAEFRSILDARAHCQDFFVWYNKEHRHSGIGLMTPEDVHYGRMSYRLGGQWSCPPHTRPILSASSTSPRSLRPSPKRHGQPAQDGAGRTGGCTLNS